MILSYLLIIKGLGKSHLKREEKKPFFFFNQIVVERVATTKFFNP